MTENFDKLITETVNPILKENGFKKKGLNFFRRNAETQEIINIQKSKGNSIGQFSFYINCGILINELTSSVRELKNEAQADIRKRINDISKDFSEDAIHIIPETNFDSLKNRITNAFENDIILYFQKHSTEESCILEMVNSGGLYKDKELLDYLCVKKNSIYIVKYIKNVRKLLTESSGIERTEKFMLRFRNQLESNDFMTTEIENGIKTAGNTV